MKAISIKQPWASLIAHGIKDIENRTWKCPQKYIGQRALIHASKGKGDGWVLNKEQGLKLQMHPSNLKSTFYDLLVPSSAAWLYPIAYRTIRQYGQRKESGTGY